MQTQYFYFSSLKIFQIQTCIRSFPQNVLLFSQIRVLLFYRICTCMWGFSRIVAFAPCICKNDHRRVLFAKWHPTAQPPCGQSSAPDTCHLPHGHRAVEDMLHDHHGEEDCRTATLWWRSYRTAIVRWRSSRTVVVRILSPPKIRVSMALWCCRNFKI